MERLGNADPRSDQELVDALNRGDHAAFEPLYYRYRDWAARLAWRFTGNRDDALDVLQEAFAYLAGKFPGFELRARLTTFLYPAVKNLSLARRRKRRPETADDDLLASLPAAENHDTDTARAELAAATAALPGPQREALLLRYVDDLSTAETAEALSVPEGTVKSRLYAALDALRHDPRARRYFEP